jgi:hypothetical protein
VKKKKKIYGKRDSEQEIYGKIPCTPYLYKSVRHRRNSSNKLQIDVLNGELLGVTLGQQGRGQKTRFAKPIVVD